MPFVECMVPRALVVTKPNAPTLAMDVLSIAHYLAYNQHLCHFPASPPMSSHALPPTTSLLIRRDSPWITQIHGLPCVI